ncbi:hypothetical protein [Actinomadura alba]|uniref:SCO6045-like C-terminal domain-containing protein n=1 Tax=Actinomadura alba TaxID=406431 RepID=A0ABR7LL50_9ACTN|nr:hypothetical protein [Actinomadura alba]MBC6465408.1 hypothetical protein [Actinomadura alba]
MTVTTPDPVPDPPLTAREELAAAQERLVRALVAGDEPPPGFDPARIAVAARALLNKRAGEVARAWPRLAAAHGARWPAAFADWAAGTPSRGAWLDGWGFARSRRAHLPPAAAAELAGCEAHWSYRPDGPPRRRRVAVGRLPGGVIVQVLGRAVVVRPRRSQLPR